MALAAETLVVDLTTGGEAELDSGKIQALKRLWRGSAQAQPAVFEHLLSALEARHSQVRVAALQVVHTLFLRSHRCRELCVAQLPRIFRLTFGAYRAQLPLPLEHARRLRALAAEYLYVWVERFGAAYQRLVYGFRYLRFIESVDFRDAAKAYRNRWDTERIQRRRQAFVANRREYMQRTLVAVQADYLKRRREIGDALMILDNCFAMLIPDIADIFGNGQAESPAEGAEDDSDLDEVLAVTATNRHAIDFSIDPDHVLEADETSDNSAVFDVVRDYLRLCLRDYRPRVQQWAQRLARIDRDITEEVGLLTDAVDRLAKRLATAVEKCRDVGVDPQSVVWQHPAIEGDVDDDDEFEDALELPDRRGQVPVAKAQRKPNPVFALLGEEGMKTDPTYVDPELLRDRGAEPLPAAETSSNPVEDRLREVAPVVSYGPDLMRWGDDEVNANTTGLEVRHRFLGSAREEPIVTGAARDMLRKRAVYYNAPRDRPEIRACRAPLPSGRLCPRRDLVKCPLHGRIIPRDERGHPEAGFEAEDGLDAGSSDGAGRAEVEPSSNSVATAERMEDLRWQDLQGLVGDSAGAGRKRKSGAAQPKRKSALASIRKPKASGINRLRKIVDKRP
ncbi:hypothetical protein GGF46_001769 [Coemansia sp. RSA 552]|nr:hypothetical protein GGF46_001769 [Coemansia sp. RSA 552]